MGRRETRSEVDVEFLMKGRYPRTHAVGSLSLRPLFTNISEGGVRLGEEFVRWLDEPCSKSSLRIEYVELSSHLLTEKTGSKVVRGICRKSGGNSG